MQIPKKFLHDRVVLLTLTLLAILLAAGISVILLRFDAKNSTTIVGFRPNVVGNNYVAGRPLDIYALGMFMVLTSVGAAILSAHVYEVRRYLSIFILSSSVLLLLLATIVTNALITF